MHPNAQSATPAMPDTTPPPPLLSARQAAERLQVRLQTLYSYASRGLLTARPEPGSNRSLYEPAEVERLALRRRRNPAPAEPAWASAAGTAVAAALPPWGRSGVTAMGPQGPSYRGRPFDELARHPGRFENVAEMLWSGLLMDSPLSWEVNIRAELLNRALDALPPSPQEVPVLRSFNAIALALGESALDEQREGNTITLARRLLLAFAASFARFGAEPRALTQPTRGASVAQVALQALGVTADRPMLAAVDALLIACADHELSTSTLAVRVAASTGAGLNACIGAGLYTHSGHWLGGSVDRIEDLLASSPPAASTHGLRLQALDARLLAGSQAYPFRDGDPRARFLLEVAKQANAQRFEAFMDKLGHMDPSARAHPSLQVGVLAVAWALGLPRRAGSALSVLGRSAGWAAHVMEQRLSAEPIRPCWPIP